MDCFLSDEDVFSVIIESHLSSELNAFGASWGCKVQRNIHIGGEIRIQLTTTTVVQNITPANDPQELQQDKTRKTPDNNSVCNPADPLHFCSLLNQVN